jgi:hypothetical protein
MQPTPDEAEVGSFSVHKPGPRDDDNGYVVQTSATARKV